MMLEPNPISSPMKIQSCYYISSIHCNKRIESLPKVHVAALYNPAQIFKKILPRYNKA